MLRSGVGKIFPLGFQVGLQFVKLLGSLVERSGVGVESVLAIAQPLLSPLKICALLPHLRPPRANLLISIRTGLFSGCQDGRCPCAYVIDMKILCRSVETIGG